jgi:hypothetical protein
MVVLANPKLILIEGRGRSIDRPKQWIHKLQAIKPGHHPRYLNIKTQPPPLPHRDP